LAKLKTGSHASASDNPDCKANGRRDGRPPWRSQVPR
jgi:hypothetical protein